MLYTYAFHHKHFEKMCTQGQDLINVTILTASSVTFLNVTVIFFLLQVLRGEEQETAMKVQTITAAATAVAVGGHHQFYPPLLLHPQRTANYVLASLSKGIHRPYLELPA